MDGISTILVNANNDEETAAEEEKQKSTEEKLATALQKANERADDLSRVLQAAGLTEGGKRIAMATIYESGGTRIAANSLAVGIPSQTSATRSEPVSSPGDVQEENVVENAIEALDRVIERVQPEDGERPPPKIDAKEVHEALETIVANPSAFDDAKIVDSCRRMRRALDWCSYYANRWKCDRISKRNPLWRDVNAVGATLIAAMRPACGGLLQEAKSKMSTRTTDENASAFEAIKRLEKTTKRVRVDFGDGGGDDGWFPSPPLLKKRKDDA